MTAPENARNLSMVDSIIEYGTKSQDCKLSAFRNKIIINKGKLIANRPMSLSKDWTVTSKKEGLVLDALTEGFKLTIGRARLHKATRSTMSMILANLIQSRSHDAPVLYNRSTSYGNKLLIQIIDYLAAEGYLMTVIGKANEHDANGSWFVGTSLFGLMVEREAIKLALSKDATFLELRAKKARGQIKGDLLPIKKTVANRLELHGLSAPVVAYNEMWLSHSATIDGGELKPFTRRIFNRALSLGGRFYCDGGSHQQLKKARRPLILIDDCPTIEPDYKAMHPTILYGLAGIQLSKDEINDLYNIEGYARHVVKIAVLILINCSSEASFKAMVSKSGKPENAKLEGYIVGLPEGINGGDLLKAIKDKHAPIASYFGKRDIGLKLQRIDSDVLAMAIHALAALDAPMLPMHDSLVCKVTDRTLVLDVMAEAFQKVTGFTAIIDCS